jgi:cell division transport system permease protein
VSERPLNESRGASAGRPGLDMRARNYILRHLQSLFYALGQMVRRPLAAAMTASVIGIALALPTGLHLLLKNAQQVTSGWDGATQMSLFLRQGTGEKQALALAETLRQRPEIEQVEYVSRDDAMEEFRRLSGFGEALDALDTNPLPAVLIVRPGLRASDPESIESLLNEMRDLPSVDMAQLDMLWVKRLYSLMNIINRGVWVLGTLLGLAVLLVVGNTIRLAIQNRESEIVVMKLIGGTDAFIRRPFLYSGFWYGLAGGLTAVLLVNASLLLLQDPVHQLAALYHSQFRLDSLDLAGTGAVLGGGTILGLLGSWLAVGRHLRDIEPT